MTPERIRRAAEILREEAQTLASSHRVMDRWPTPGDPFYEPCDDTARQSHDEMLALSIQLDLLAEERHDT